MARPVAEDHDDEQCELVVVMTTLSEPRAKRFADLMAEHVAHDMRSEVIGAGARRGWKGGAADILVRSQQSSDLTDLDVAVEDAVPEVWLGSETARDAAVLIQVVRAGEFGDALADGHVTMRDALRGMGLY